MVLFSGVRSRVAEAEPPKSFEGLPITLVSAAIVSLSFFGLTLLSIGIIGIYLMNILNEAKKMPHYVIRQEETD